MRICRGAIHERREQSPYRTQPFAPTLATNGLVVESREIKVFVMTGGRSTESAANNLAALVGRARTEAIGLQRASGVLFFMDQGTDRVGALVEQPSFFPNFSGRRNLLLATFGERALGPQGGSG